MIKFFLKILTCFILINELNAQVVFSGTQTVTSQNFPNGVIIQSGAVITMNGTFIIGTGKRIYIEDQAFLIVENSTLGGNAWTGIEMATVANWRCPKDAKMGAKLINSTIRNAFIGIRNADVPFLGGIPNSTISDVIGGFVDIDGCTFDNRWVDVCLYNEQKICGKRGEIKNSIFNSNNSVSGHSAIDLQNNGKDIINNIFYNQKNSLHRYYAITLKNYTGLIKNHYCPTKIQL